MVVTGSETAENYTSLLLLVRDFVNGEEGEDEDAKPNAQTRGRTLQKVKNFSNFTRLELCVARMQFLPRIGRLTMLFFVLMAFLTALFVL